MAERYDAIIIGAGIIGASIGYELAKRGWRTLNLDRLPAAGYGSTGSSCAVIRTYYSTWDGTALAYEGLHYWRNWADHVGAAKGQDLARFHNCGVVVLRAAGDASLARICTIMDDLGIAYESWDRATLAKRLPIYDLRSFAPPKRPDDPDFGKATGGAIVGALFMPDGGYVGDPQLAARNVATAAEAKGGRFRFNAAVVEIRKARGGVAGVTLADGTAIDAPVVVNAAGPHSAILNRLAGVEAGMRIRTRPRRQEVAHVPSPPDFDYEGSGFVVSDTDVGCYSRPELGNHILIGSQDPACDPPDWADPDDFDRNLSDQAAAQVYRVAQRIPGLPIPSNLKGVVDLYDVSDDWIPIYDKSDLPGFYMAVGTSGNQFKNGPVAGAMMAELIVRCEAGHDHDAEPIEFDLRHIGRRVSIGFYSRRRELNRASSMSVLG